MRPQFKPIVFGILCLLPLSGFAKDTSPPILRLLDVEDPDAIQNTGVWVHNILDSEQNLKREFVTESASLKKVVRLDYDVDSPNSAMAGFWINLRNQDLRGFDTLHVNIKTGGVEQFPGNIAFQFTDADGHKAAYLVSRIPDEWKAFRVPLKNFKRINNWAEIKEFEIIIDDINARPKEGVLLIDEIYVSKDH